MFPSWLNKDTWLAYYANFMVQAQNYYIAPMLAVILLAQGVSTEIFSVIMIIMIIPAVTSRLLSGFWLNKVGLKRGTLWAYGCLGASLSLYMALGTLPWQAILVILFLQTLTQSFASTGVNALMNDLAKEQYRAKIIGWAGIIGFLSMPLSQLVSLPLANTSYILWGGCISLLVWSSLVTTQRIQYQDQNQNTTKISVHSRFFDRETFNWSMTTVGSVVAHGAVSTLIPLYAITLLSGWGSILFYIAYCFGIIVSRSASGVLADRQKFKLLYAISIPLVTAGLIILALLPNSLGLFLAGILIGLGYPTNHLTAQKIANQQRIQHIGSGQVSATYWSSYDVAMTLGKASLIFLGWVDFRWIWVGISAFQLISIGWLIWMKRRSRLI